MMKRSGLMIAAAALLLSGCDYCPQPGTLDFAPPCSFDNAFRCPTPRAAGPIGTQPGYATVSAEAAPPGESTRSALVGSNSSSAGDGGEPPSNLSFGGGAGGGGGAL